VKLGRVEQVQDAVSFEGCVPAEAEHERRQEERGGGPIGGGAESPASETEGDPIGLVAGPALLAGQSSRGADTCDEEGM
jgi:hypothetical protein